MYPIIPTIRTVNLPHDTKAFLQNISDFVQYLGNSCNDSLADFFNKNAVSQREALISLALHIAAQPLNITRSEPPTLFFPTDFGRLTIQITHDTKNSDTLLIQIDRHQKKITGKAGLFPYLQQKIISDVVLNTRIYQTPENDAFIDKINQTATLLTLISGFTHGLAVLPKNTPGADLFVANIIPIYMAFRTYFLNADPTNKLVAITLSNGTQLVLQEANSRIRMTMGGALVIIGGYSLHTLWKNVYADLIIYKSRYGEKAAIYTSMTALEWQGAIYDKASCARQSTPFNKEQPYLSTKQGELKNLNCQVNFSPSDTNKQIMLIVCSHMALAVMKNFFENHNGKIDWRCFSTTNALQTHISIELDALYDVIRRNPLKAFIVHNHKIGEYMTRCFMEMLVEGESSRAWLLESTTHAMTMLFQIKGDPKKESDLTFVLRFYDPNTSNATVRVEKKSLGFITLSLQELLDGTAKDLLNGRHRRYYRQSEPISVVREYNASGFKKLNTPPLNPVITLTNSPDPYRESLTPTPIYLLLVGNFVHDFNNLKPYLHQLGTTSPDALYLLLAAKNNDGTPWLTTALLYGTTYGDEKTVDAYLQMINDVIHDENHRIKLLSVKSEQAEYALSLAVKMRRTQEIILLGKSISLINNETERVRLLIAAMPAFKNAIRKGYSDVVAAYLAILGMSVHNQATLFTFHKSIAAAMTTAIRANHVTIVTDWSRSLHRINDESRRAQLLGRCISAHKLAVEKSTPESEGASIDNLLRQIVNELITNPELREKLLAAISKAAPVALS